jgi:formate dehydrogenase subunit delta
MRIERLVSMANDIGAFFDGEPDKAEAARGVASHLKRFWDPRMRREIVAHYREGGAGLDPLVRSAISLLADAPAAAPPQTTAR